MPDTWPSGALIYVVLIVYSTSCLGAFVLALTFKLLQFYRHELEAVRHRDNDVRSPRRDVIEADSEDKDSRDGQTFCDYHRRRRRSERPGARHGLLLAMQYFLGFCLVLIFVSCNVPLCVCAVLGGTLGFLINKWKRNRTIPIQRRRQYLH